MFGNQSSFWESTRALIMLFLTRKKGCSEIKVVKKKPHRILSCVSDGVWKELGTCRWRQDVSQWDLC